VKIEAGLIGLGLFSAYVRVTRPPLGQGFAPALADLYPNVFLANFAVRLRETWRVFSDRWAKDKLFSNSI